MFKIELSKEEWDGVQWALQEAPMPMKVTYPLLLKIGEQLKRQGYNGTFASSPQPARDAKRQ